MVNLSDVFIGTKQSKFAGIAIFLAIIVVCISILFTNTDISLGKRFGIVLFIILASIPSVLLSLFELSCIVTGGSKNKNEWCYYFAWLIAVIIIIYCIIIIISGIMSMFTYNSAMEKVKHTEINKRLSKEDANTIAVNMISYDSETYTETHLIEHPHVEEHPLEKPHVTDNSSSFQSQKVPTESSYERPFYDHELSIAPTATKPSNMAFKSPVDSNPNPQWMANNVKPMINSSGTLGTSHTDAPAPYISDNFSSY